MLSRGLANELIALNNDGAGHFSLPALVFQGPVFNTAVVDDFNGDSRPDIAVALNGTQAFAVLLANASGGYNAPVNHTTGVTPHVHAVGDLNNDGFVDLATSEGDFEAGTARVTVMLGDGNGGFGPQLDVNAGSTVAFPTSADVNGDGFRDLIETFPPIKTVGVQLGDGAGSFTAPAQFVLPSETNPAVGDLNGDGRPDFVAGGDDGTIAVFLNNCGQPSVNLGLTIAESADPINEGEELVYTLTLTNPTDVDATNVQLTADANGPEVTLLETTASSGGTFDGENGGWRFPVVPANSTTTIVFRVRPEGGGTVQVSRAVTAGTADPNPSNNYVTETTTVNVLGRTLVVTK